MDERTFPSITFSGISTLDLGDRTLEIIEISGHTMDPCVIWDNNTGVLVTGDFVGWKGINKTLPQYEDAGLYISSIKKMIDLEPSYLISRHLTIIEGKEKVKIFLEESISYAHRIDELVREGIGRK